MTLCKNCAFTEEEFQNLIVERINRIVHIYEFGSSEQLAEIIDKLHKLLSVYDPKSQLAGEVDESQRNS